ncbi:MAG: hypothetical protein K2R98_07285 [Gemmataceae bacterium]|nr:hypothetical protein [Gemmataceae bacterium]
MARPSRPTFSTRWCCGHQAVAGQLIALHFRVAALPTGWLGESLGSAEILLDSTGGYGWFVDGTPDQDEELPAARARARRLAPPGALA